MQIEKQKYGGGLGTRLVQSIDKARLSSPSLKLSLVVTQQGKEVVQFMQKPKSLLKVVKSVKSVTSQKNLVVAQSQYSSTIHAGAQLRLLLFCR